MQPRWLNPLRGLAGAAVLGAAIGASVWLDPNLPLIVSGALVLLGMLLLSQPVHLLFLLVVLTPFTAAIPAGALIPILSPYDLMLILVTVLMAVFVLLCGRRTLLPPALIAALVAFGLGTSVGPLYLFLARGDPLELGDVVSLLAPLKFLLVFWLFMVGPRTTDQRSNLIRWMVYSATVVAGIGLLQAARLPMVDEILNAVYPSAQTANSLELGRVTSVMGAWNSLGLFLLTALMIIAATIADERSRGRRRGLILCAAIVLACLLATNLYSGLIGAALGLLILKTSDPRGIRSLMPLVLVSVLGALVLLPTIIQRAEMQFEEESWVPQTLRFRYHVWTDYFIPAIAEEPWLGVSPNFDDIPFPYPESQYIYYLYRSGALSLVAHLIWIASLLTWLISSRKREPPGPDRQLNRSVALIPIVLILVLSLIGAINPVFTYTGSMTYFWMIVGLIINAKQGANYDAT
mgnify:CR=1 FL=1